MGKTAALTAIAFLWGTSAIAQGVPTVDGSLIIRNEASNAHRESDLATQRETLAVQEEIAAIEQEQLSILQQILDAQTSLGGQGIPGMVSALEDGADPEASADVVYDPEDSNPGAAQMFGDAAKNVEELIIQVAQETHGLSGVGQAGFSVREWRYMLQALIWQESRFSIGARSPVGAFGLTQIMPGTAGDLGIYPDYYDSPYLQVEGGARYLAQMLAMFDGNIIHALAAYNAGPGNVQNYGGVPPFQETQHYVQVIPAKYNEYLARGGGGDAVGTIDPALLANSNLSFTGAGASFYANNSMATVEAAARRLQSIIQRISETEDVQEAMALNTYARAEFGRLSAIMARLLAARARPASAESIALAADRQREQQFMNFNMEDFD
ncbi:Transglycosylase SLT domain-containing protein [Celeribacter baekdonensis]|uniref:Transglycosylase SLT domain-containing protein n=1 Tax=Celeribacter baekdonensis TaxID=875171 RepID=A0A1G7URB9_9RHOB|nr:lytic transglycosylase domain-containing protein [Celeribacter baekdonensis]SDG49250.1 Transglycosylase SLT domain-containing protein [Celeribacter baekdonensis]